MSAQPQEGVSYRVGQLTPFMGGARDLGYSLVAPASPTGALWQMMAPGAEGRGLMMVSYAYLCGDECSVLHQALVSHWDGEAQHSDCISQEPLLLPAVVDWFSTTVASGMTLKPNMEIFEWYFESERHGAGTVEGGIEAYDDFALPMVGIKNVQVAHPSIISPTSCTTGDNYFMDSPLSMPGVEALTPIYSVLPLSDSYDDDCTIADIRRGLQEIEECFPVDNCMPTDFAEVEGLEDAEAQILLAKSLGHDEACIDSLGEWSAFLTCHWDPHNAQMQCGGMPHRDAVLAWWADIDDPFRWWKAVFTEEAMDRFRVLEEQYVSGTMLVQQMLRDHKRAKDKPWASSFWDLWSPWPWSRQPDWPRLGFSASSK